MDRIGAPDKPALSHTMRQMIERQRTAMKAWIEALRLRTLPLSMSGVIVAAGLAAHYGVFRIEVFIPMLVMVLLMQILSNFADEYGDLEKGVDNEGRIGPVRGMQRGEIGKEQMRRAMIGCGILTFCAGMVLLVISFGFENARLITLFAVLGLLCIAAAIKYTVGRGAYGYYALGDVVCLCCYGLVAVIGGFFLHAHFVTVAVCLPAVGLGLLICAMLNLNNMRDRENDAACGKNTLVVLLGQKKALLYHCWLLICGMLGFLAFNTASGIGEPLRYLYVLLFIPLVMQLARTLKVKDPAEYDKLMKPISMTTALLSLVFALCIGL